jgi:hypothetical protein
VRVFTPAERGTLNELLLHARATGDDEAFRLLAGLVGDPDGFRALLDSFKAAKTEGRVTREAAPGPPPRAGLVLDRTKHRWVRPGGSDGDPATPDHDPELAAHAAASLDGLPPEVTKSPGAMARLGDTLLTVAAKVHLKLTAMTPAMLQVGEVLGAVFDTPNDLKKLGYNPTSGGTASGDAAGANDPLKAHMGISTHLACTIASKVLSGAVAWAKKQRGASVEEDGWQEWGALVAEVFAAVNESLGLEGGIPDAADIAAKLKEMCG